MDLTPGINCISGKNGSGKTNILDAVHYLSMCKSYLNAVDKQNILFGEHFFMIQGDWFKNEKSQSIHCAVKAGAKKVFKKNKVEYEKLAEHIGLFPSVIISPYDRDLISEGSELRRKWMDSIISQFDRSYLENLQLYAKVVTQRNALLKNMYENGFFEQESIDVWNDKMIQLGTKIFASRKEFLEEFIPVFQKNYNFIGEEAEEVHLEYKSQLLDKDFSLLLQEYQRKDTVTQYSNVGIHKDDLIFSIKGHSVKKFGSQGQQKSFLIALKLAQYEWLKKHLKVNPLLMLDDIFDKLDNDRVGKLMQLVSESNFGQVIVTDTNGQRVKEIFDTIQVDVKLFDTEDLCRLEIEKAST